jgi:hypothetical protein
MEVNNFYLRKLPDNISMLNVILGESLHVSKTKQGNKDFNVKLINIIYN